MSQSNSRINKSKPVSSLRAALLLLAIPLLSACGGEDPVSPIRTGVFLDSAVAGLQYATDTNTGVTDAEGTFTYTAGESITFSIGGMSLPTVRAASTVTPLEVFTRGSASALPVVNLSRLLQTLDNDRNPANGINLADTSAFTAGTMIDFNAATFDNDVALLLNATAINDKTLVDATTAANHLQQTLVENGLSSDDCTAVHPYVGRQVNFTTQFHNVSGNLTVLDDCTLQVRNFNYDGQGPAVYFYGAQDRDYNAAEAFILGSKLNGQVFLNDTIRLTLPEGKTLDDLNSISVWCADFQVNFGDAFFGDQ